MEETQNQNNFSNYGGIELSLWSFKKPCIEGGAGEADVATV